MSIADPINAATLAHAVVDPDGRLVSADPALLTLNARAGGAVGEPLGVPQLATAARLARRLGVVVSRPVVVADIDLDIDLWVRAQPDESGVRLAVSGWRERPMRAPRAAGEAAGLAGVDPWSWRTDAALRLTHLSPALGRALGFDSASLLGQPVGGLFPGQGVSTGLLGRHERLVDRRLACGPSRRDVLVSAEVLRDALGRFAGFSGTARLQDEATDTAPAPQPPPALSQNFTSGLDRALRRPLASIIANAESIHSGLEGPIATDYADYAADIAGAGRHLLALIDDLVDLQAVERPDFALTVEPVDLADLARRAAGLLAVRAEAAGVTIERPPADLQIPATGEFRRVLQILVNLIGNAVRYAPRGSAVVVTAEAGQVSVLDRGKGIAVDDQARVFEKFERVDPSEPGGNGLGLYIARRLARAMGGDLTLESAPGEGARFTLALPPRQSSR